MTPARVDILGVPVHCVTMPQALDAVGEMIAGGERQAVLAVNPEKVMHARRNPQLLAQLQRAALLIPDGIGVVLAARLLGLGRLERVPGSELMPLLCARAAEKGYTVFVFGATPEVNERAVAEMRRRWPAIRIVGAHHGYVAEDAVEALIRRINDLRPDILFVGLGSPKQEAWIDRYLPSMQVRVCQGVGGTLDILAGRVKRAPALMRRVHLEWFYRLLAEPSRAARQAVLPLFAWQVLKKVVWR
jgi:N-acetylglucosaminyldiphosphoundecaprenol N-acetyl-beta-D-mannosaminyltransferase